MTNASDTVANAIPTIPAYQAPEGSVVEFYVKGHGPRLGIVDNLPARRVLARVHHFRSEGDAGVGSPGELVAFDPDGVRYVLSAGHRVTVVANQAEAGWGRLARAMDAVRVARAATDAGRERDLGHALTARAALIDVARRAELVADDDLGAILAQAGALVVALEARVEELKAR